MEVTSNPLDWQSYRVRRNLVTAIGNSINVGISSWFCASSACCWGDLCADGLLPFCSDALLVVDWDDCHHRAWLTMPCASEPQRACASSSQSIENRRSCACAIYAGTHGKS